MFDAGMNSLPALREYSVSPRAGSTMRIPQCAFANAGASASESIIARSSAFVPVDRVAGDGDDIGDRHATLGAARQIFSLRRWRMHPGGKLASGRIQPGVIPMRAKGAGDRLSTGAR